MALTNVPIKRQIPQSLQACLSLQDGINLATESFKIAVESPSHLLPNGAIDTHVHVFDRRLGPYAPDRSYTPGHAPYSQLASFSKRISSSDEPAKLVFVQPSPYRTDNTVLLTLLRMCQAQSISARGIAVVNLDTVTNAQLCEMHGHGVRGLRLNMQADGHNVNTETLQYNLRAAADRIKHLPGWKVQIFAPGFVWEELAPIIRDLPVTVIADHTGGLLAPSKLNVASEWSPASQPGLSSLVSLARDGKVLVKISGLYRSSDATQTNFSDMANIIRKLAVLIPDHLIWGSDWPHTGEGKTRLSQDLQAIEPFRVIDDLAIIANLKKWVGESTWMKMMVTNPQREFFE